MHFLLANCVRPPGQIVKDGRTFVVVGCLRRHNVIEPPCDSSLPFPSLPPLLMRDSQSTQWFLNSVPSRLRLHQLFSISYRILPS